MSSSFEKFYCPLLSAAGAVLSESKMLTNGVGKEFLRVLSLCPQVDYVSGKNDEKNTRSNNL